MPVGIHYNEQFAAYAEFATESVAAGKSKSVVRTANDADATATDRMKAAPNDGPGGFAALFRSGASKKANDIARDIFRQSVYDIFGGESLVPPSVREAMKLEDYGSGKPLTARRILAVKEAIDQEMMRFAETFEAAKATAPKALRQTDEKARAGELEILGEALRRCGLDRDAEAIVAKHADKFLLAPNESPRSAADVRAKVDRLLANLAELRAIAKGDASVLGAGLELLDDLAGKDITDGFLTKLARAAKSAKIDEIKGLSGTSKPLDIHKAVVRFRDSVEGAVVAAGAKDVLKGGDELDPCRQFLGELMILRCGESGVRSVRTALCTVAASQTLSVYAGIEDGKVPLGVSSAKLKQEIWETASALDRSLELFRFSAHALLHQKPNELKPFRTSRPTEAEFTSPEIVKDLTAMSERRIARDIQATVDRYVKGAGDSADLVRNLIRTRLGPCCLDPAAKMSALHCRLAKNMINRTMSGEMRLFRLGKAEQTLFAKDRNRGVHVRLPDGTMLSDKVPAARDQIARLVTRDPEAAYERLDETAKHKAEFVMSFLSQGGETVADYDFFTMLDPNMAKVPCYLPEQRPTASTDLFELDLSANGDLTVRFTRTLENARQLYVDKTSEMRTIPPAGFTSAYELRIPAAEFDRLANADFSRYDYDANEKVAHDAKVDPNQAAVDAMGRDFAFGEGVTCTASFSCTFTGEKARR